MEPILDPELSQRFCYWRGHSGRRYIHTVYEAGDCPPLPGAVYLAVERDRLGARRALAAGRFSSIWELASRVGVKCKEVHVHLLAATDGEAEAVVADLARSLRLTVAQPHISLRSPAVAEA